MYVVLINFDNIFLIAASHVKRGSHRKAKPATVGIKHFSMFFGYDLPDYITEEDIISFLEEYEQFVVSVEVMLNEKHGNYAKVTFNTSADAQAAMRHYSGQYWHEFGVSVILKPWKEKEMPQKKKQQHSGYSRDESNIVHDSLNASHESLHQSETYSSTGSFFLLPYPDSHESKAGRPIYSEGEAMSTELTKKEKEKKSGSAYKDYYSEEFTIKISGLSFDTKEKDIVKLVKPFGDLTSRIRIASYPQNGICYAYANYCSSSSAIAAVSKLDKSEFNGLKIHVCHRGELGVDHSCRKMLQILAAEEYDDVSTTSVESVKQVQETINPDLLQVSTQESAEKSGIATSYASVTKKSSPKPVKDLHKKKQKPNKTVAKKSKSTVDTFEKSQPSSNIEDFTKYVKQDSIPGLDTSPMQKQVFENVASCASVTQTSPKSVKVPHEKTVISVSALEAKFYSDDINNSVGMTDCKHLSQSEHQPLNDNSSGANFDQCLDSSTIPNLPLTVSPQIQVTEVFKDIASHTYTTQSLSQAVNTVQATKVDSILQQQSKFNVDDAKSNCILEVTNLHPDASVQDLERYFKPYGDLTAPISIRLHPASDSCSAIVHYVSPDAAQNAMMRLNGCDFSGYQMCIVNASCKDGGRKLADDKTVISDSTTVSLVGPRDLHTPARTMVERVSHSEIESSSDVSCK